MQWLRKENANIVFEHSEGMPIKPLLANLLFSSISSEMPKASMAVMPIYI